MRSRSSGEGGGIDVIDVLASPWWTLNLQVIGLWFASDGDV